MRKTGRSASIYRLIYCSRNLIATLAPDGELEREVRSLLASARRYNKADNVTGALLFTASGFAQVLEGAREIVECTFERISRDPRHADVTVLSFTPTEHRSFPEWSMGFRGQKTSAASDPLVHVLADATFAGPRVTTGTDVLRLLEKVVQREDEWIVT